MDTILIGILGAIMGFVLSAAMLSILSTVLIDESSVWYHEEDLVEEGVGEYYLDEDDKKQFRFIEDK